MVTANYGMLMDDVMSVRNLSSRPYTTPLNYHPVPQIYPVNLPLEYDDDLQIVIKVCFCLLR